MKRYSVGVLGVFESEEGEWVPADIAAQMYEALKDARPHLDYKLTHTQTAQGRKNVARVIERVDAATAKAEGALLASNSRTEATCEP